MTTTASSFADQEWWARIGHLWDRATGGADVAAMPTSASEYWDTSPRPAGVEAAIDWFIATLDSQVPAFLFLVGGPGAGKSHTASELVSSLEQVNSVDTGLARRTYFYLTSKGRPVTLVNDATIPDDEVTHGALLADIHEAIDSSGSLVACVNRGVLVEERASLRAKEIEGQEVARALTLWLADEIEPQDMIEDVTRSEYLRFGRIRSQSGDSVAEVLAVAVDVCSLLEPTPLATYEIEKGFSAAPYHVIEFTDRPSAESSPIPAIDLIAKVVSRLAPSETDSGLVDPISANAKSLSDPSVQRGVASVLRASEIVSAQRMTYRELWGAVTRILVGGMPRTVERDLVHEYIANSQPKSADPVIRYREVMKLANLRFSQSMFVDDTSRTGTYDPVLHLTSRVDPALDARPGWFSSEDWASGWSTPITDAFDTPIVDATPLDGLRASLPAEDAFHAAVTSFESVLDEAYAVAMTVASQERQRFELAAQYGAYLTRLYATANGITAFRPEVSLWTRARKWTPTVPDELRVPLRTLLRPKRRPDLASSTSVIPVFDSRTDPIIGRSPQPRFGLRTGDVQMETRSTSDEVVLTLLEQGKKVASVNLDFVLVREALACDAERPGITDGTEIASPRLERFRSARLLSGQLEHADFCAIVDDAEVQVSVSGS